MSDDTKKTRRAKAEDDIPSISIMEKLPPHSESAEAGVLGCILLQPDCMDICVDKFKDGALVFYDLRHQTIFSALAEMHHHRKGIDLLTVLQHLKDKQQLEEVGGLEYLSTLPDKVPSAANLTHYADIVREKYLLRQLIKTSTGIIGRAYEQEGDVDALMDQCEKELLAINGQRATVKTLTLGELVMDAGERMCKALEQPEVMPGISTGFHGFDKLTLGLVGGEVFVVAARPSVGKTAYAYNVIDHMAHNGIPVGVISLEMKASQLVDRQISAHAGVDSQRIRRGNVSEAEQQQFRDAAASIINLPIHIDDERGVNILQIRAKMRRMIQQHGCRVFMIDYLQKIEAVGGKFGNREQVVSQISSGIKNFAGEHNVAIILLAQLNRDLLKGDKPRAPHLGDLRESGGIEQDADDVLLLWQPKEQDIIVHNDADDWVNIDGILAKQRNGPQGKVPLRFYKRFTKFTDRPGAESEPEDSQWYGAKKVDGAF